MKIKFLSDFRGRLTRERFYQEGEVAEFDAATAAQIIALGRAIPAEPPAAEPSPEVERMTPRLPARKGKTK